MGHSISHGKYVFFFLAKNTEIWEVEYIHLKAHGMYLSVLSSDMDMWTGVHMHFTFQNNCVGDLVLQWNFVKWNSICTWKQHSCVVEVHRSSTQWYIKHCVIMPYHIEQLQGIQRWKSIHCSYASQWTLYPHRHVCDHNWAYRGLWDNITTHLMPAVNNVQDCCQVGTASLKLGATVDTLWDMNQCGTVSLWRGYVK